MQEKPSYEDLERRVCDLEQALDQKRYSYKIAFIDDEEPVCRLACHVLKSLGFEVTAFTAVDDVVQAFEKDAAAFDAVISDYSMPSMTGPELIQQLRCFRSDIPVLIITGYAHLATNEQAKEWDCQACLAKPYDIDELKQALGLLFNQK